MPPWGQSMTWAVVYIVVQLSEPCCTSSHLFSACVVQRGVSEVRRENWYSPHPTPPHAHTHTHTLRCIGASFPGPLEIGGFSWNFCCWCLLHSYVVWLILESGKRRGKKYETHPLIISHYSGCNLTPQSAFFFFQFAFQSSRVVVSYIIF